jgi:hypothetical protein
VNLDFGPATQQLRAEAAAWLAAHVRAGPVRVGPNGLFVLAPTLLAQVALQVHGAIGYTAEHDLSLFLARARALVPARGSQASHRARGRRAITGAGT